MNRNPYSPPGATVGDADSAHTVERPRAVSVAVALLWSSMLIGVPVAILRISQMGGIEFKTAAIVLVTMYGLVFGISYWLFGAVRTGRNWARITILVLTIIYAAVQPITIAVTLAGPPLDATVKIAQLCMWIAATVFLFMPAPRAWYHAMKEG